ncbi:MAG: bifunctional phosphopantothenoylcysteine decarboxylase/phosphopantothenate--cysteine ligase CoaBC [Burkholderiaceae bacterium]|jgi:phosphopantothenoylcysteine decarboxylase/phosphopantothenate--cysteine ligase|nr:bifunctional phosphopantothenoylcysteine decarboxylase/phosphopantothenate--cysteine ligase CoaBC [Burkholderiaceae bacterium]
MNTQNPTTDAAASNLAGRRIVLGLTGSVACYKAAQLCRALVRAGAAVQPVMTEGACRFIAPATLQALSGRAVFVSQWDTRPADGMAHIQLGRAADAIVVAPASADFIAQLAQGRGAELLALLCLARPAERVALLLAPAMNRQMWAHPATQRNVAQVQADGALLLGVAHGAQACGESGDGRMLEAADLLEEVIAHFTPKWLRGQRVLVTAGPTFEAIDPVRGITNLSSGKMGFAIARAAREAGAQVTLVAGPVQLPTPRGVARLDVTSASQMHQCCLDCAGAADIFIATAAVADWRPEQVAAHKIKKTPGGKPPLLSFVECPDILADLAQSARARAGQLYCVGFAAESENLLANAQAKRARKGVPLMVGNLGPATFGRDDNALILVDENGVAELARASKRLLARQLVAEIARRVGAAGAAPEARR